MKELRPKVNVSDTADGDGIHMSLASENSLLMKQAISAIVIAIQMITKHCKKLKYKRKIVLVTNGRGSMDAEDVSQITQKIKADGIELVVVYVIYGKSERDEN